MRHNFPTGQCQPFLTLIVQVLALQHAVAGGMFSSHIIFTANAMMEELVAKKNSLQNHLFGIILDLNRTHLTKLN